MTYMYENTETVVQCTITLMIICADDNSHISGVWKKWMLPMIKVSRIHMTIALKHHDNCSKDTVGNLASWLAPFVHQRQAKMLQFGLRVYIFVRHHEWVPHWSWEQYLCQCLPFTLRLLHPGSWDQCTPWNAPCTLISLLLMCPSAWWTNCQDEEEPVVVFHGDC